MARGKLAVLAAVLVWSVGLQAQPVYKWVDANGKTVVLHGVMDTPNRYFNGNRWGTGGYEVGDETPCLNYFEKMFTAITDKSQGAYCTVFRLHMDPCWTNYNAPAGTQENNIQYFSEKRYKNFLSRLYVKLVQKALAHGLYVIVRPPGVCPQNIKVGDEYQAYLKKVWNLFASNSIIKKYAGQVSIELANEPVHVQLADGTNSDKALHDFFQPIVDEIRSTGFKGIIWVPGSGYQSQYTGYAKYPITDSENNFSYSVHVYSGWYGNMTDKNCDHNTFIKNFQAQVPMVTSKPIMVTEIDWSPNDPDRANEGQELINQCISPNVAWSIANNFNPRSATITSPAPEITKNAFQQRLNLSIQEKADPVFQAMTSDLLALGYVDLRQAESKLNFLVQIGKLSSERVSSILYAPIQWRERPVHGV
jgi:hypothetical protein